MRKIRKHLHRWARKHPGIIAVVYPKLYESYVDEAVRLLEDSEYGAHPEAKSEVAYLRNHLQVTEIVR